MIGSDTKRASFMIRCGRKKLFFFIPLVIILALTFTYRAHQKSSYKASAILKVEDPLGIEPTDDRILTAAGASPAPLMKKRLSVSLDPQSGVMNLSLTGSSPKGLINIVNAIADAYVKELSSKAKEADKELVKEKYSEVKEYKRNLEKELEGSRVKLEGYESRMEKFKAEDSKIAAVLAALKSRLAELESERARLLRVYTTLHPDVVRIDADIANVKEEFSGVPARPTGGFELEKELEYRQKKFTELKKNWDDVKQKSIEEIISPRRTFAVTAYAKRPEPLFDPKARAAILIAGFIASLIIGLLTMLLAVLFDTSILNPEELSHYTHQVVIGALGFIKPLDPKLKSGQHGLDGLILRYDDNNKVIEPYRLLYTRIQSEILDKQPDIKSIFITSSIPREGKSVTAANLALVAARAGKKVLLIDCNLARPSIHRFFGINPKRAGLTDILNRGAALDSSIMNITDMVLGGMGMDAALKFKGLDRLSLITAGASISTAGELLRQDKIDLLLSDLKTRFDIIVLDGPPVATSADSLILAPKCQITFIVYSAGRPATPRASLRSAIHQLTTSHGVSFKAGTNLKGVIMTKCI